MPRSDSRVDSLLNAILDGSPVDWPAVESSSADQQALVRQLRVLAAVADVHRGFPSERSPSPQSVLPPGAAGGEDIPETWGHLHLLERIGRGAFGEVYRAWDPRLDREVALKLLPADPLAGQPSASVLIHEGRLLARVRHPNVVTIYGAEQIADRIGLWMELVRGRTLEHVLRERQAVAAEEAITIGLELCGAVAAVHSAGLLHRDIKTQNIMRADDGRIVLMDFGTGRELDDETSPDLTGTPLYLAPEVLAGGQATAGSDVYSLGVVLYRLVTGSYPVKADSVRDLRRAHHRGRPVYGALRRRVPRGLARIIARALDARPERRYPEVAAMRADLLALKIRARLPTLVRAGGWAAACVLGLGGWELASRYTPIVRPAAVLWLDGTGEGLRSGTGPPQTVASVEAHALYLQARALVDRRGIPNALKAAELFDRAIAADPQSAPAYAGLSTAHAFLSFPFRGLPFDTAYPIMRPAAVRALELDRRLAEAHSAMGWVYAYERDWLNAEAAFKRAIDLNPRLTQTYTSYSIAVLQPLEKYDQALQLLDLARQRDPLSLDVQREIGEVQLFSKRYTDALRSFEYVSEREPDFPFIHNFLAKALTLVGRPTEAFPLLEPGHPWRALPLVMTGRRAEAETLAAESERYPYSLAVIFGALGDTERTIQALDRAAASEPHRVGRLLIEPELQWVRDDPRVVRLRKRFGLP